MNNTIAHKVSEKRTVNVQHQFLLQQQMKRSSFSSQGQQRQSDKGRVPSKCVRPPWWIAEDEVASSTSSSLHGIPAMQPRPSTEYGKKKSHWYD